MATEIRMPQLGVSMETGVLTQWYKKVDDAVEAGEVIASIETEKLTSDISSEVGGVLVAILAQEGDELPVRSLLAIVGQPGETWESGAASPKPDAPVPATGTVVPAAPAAADGRTKASPLARKAAEKLGVDLSEVSACGRSGRIRQRDVLAFAKAKPAPVTADATDAGGVRVEKMSGIRRAVMKNMIASRQTNAQAELRMDVDMSAVIRVRDVFREAERKLSYNDIIVRCTAKALGETPIMNASVDGTDIVYHGYVNIGIAVSVPGGLIVPVIQNADQLDISGIHDALAVLVEKVRQGTLSDADYHGGTFTISSLGMYDVDSFTAIINPPESAVLAVGKITKTPVVNENDEIVVRPMCNLCLSYDHRLIDGAEAAKFMRLVKRYLQQPLALL